MPAPLKVRPPARGRGVAVCVTTFCRRTGGVGLIVFQRLIGGGGKGNWDDFRVFFYGLRIAVYVGEDRGGDVKGEGNWDARLEGGRV